MSSVPALTLAEVTCRAIDPALKLLPPAMDTPPARVQLLAIGLQESRFLYRRQIVNGQPIGPAKSFWQAEKTGIMVKGVRLHPATAELAAAVYQARGVRRLDSSIWNAIEHDDVLAAALARLALYTDPHPLPAVGDVQGAWETYLRVWRPGRPRPETWRAFYLRALDFVTSSEG